MATQLKVHKVNSLPGVVEASTLYLVKSADSNLFDLYVSSNDGTSVRHIISKSDVQGMVNTAVAGASNIHVVADIAARNALAPTTVTQAVVVDATGDATVASGAATYVYDPATTTWSKIAEYESLDLVLRWADIQNRPTSTVAEIDDAVGKKHTHANSVQLNKIGEDGNGNLTYDGNAINAYLSSDQW